MPKRTSLAAASQTELEDLLADLRTLLAKEELAVMPEIKAIRDRIESGIETVRTAAAESYDSVRAAANDVAHEAAERAREAAQRAKEAAQAADQYAHEEPWRVAGVALGLGTLIGFLIARR